MQHRISNILSVHSTLPTTDGLESGLAKWLLGSAAVDHMQVLGPVTSFNAACTL